MNMGWFRSWHGAPTDKKWLAIARRAQVPAAIVSAIAWALLDHASQAAERGSVAAFDVESYAAFSGLDEAQVAAVIAAMADKKVIVDGRLANWERRQYARENLSTPRVRAHRKRRGANEPSEDEASGVKRDETREPDMKRDETLGNDRTEENREEEMRAEKTSSLPARGAGGKGRRIPEDWQGDLVAAIAEGLTEREARREADKFRDYWRAKPGREGVKADWPATWRNWCRNAADQRGRAGEGAAAPQAPPGQVWVKYDSPTWRALAKALRAKGKAVPAHYHSPIQREDGAWLKAEEVAAAGATREGAAA